MIKRDRASCPKTNCTYRVHFSIVSMLAKRSWFDSKQDSSVEENAISIVQIQISNEESTGYSILKLIFPSCSYRGSFITVISNWSSNQAKKQSLSTRLIYHRSQSLIKRFCSGVMSLCKFMLAIWIKMKSNFVANLDLTRWFNNIRDWPPFIWDKQITR